MKYTRCPQNLQTSLFLTDLKSILSLDISTVVPEQFIDSHLTLRNSHALKLYSALSIQ